MYDKGLKKGECPDIYSKPITGKELRKHGKIVLVWKDEDDEIDEIPIKDRQNETMMTSIQRRKRAFGGDQ